MLVFDQRVSQMPLIHQLLLSQQANQLSLSTSNSNQLGRSEPLALQNITKRNGNRICVMRLPVQIAYIGHERLVHLFAAATHETVVEASEKQHAERGQFDQTHETERNTGETTKTKYSYLLKMLIFKFRIFF